jgi:hypothetical protein
MISSTVEKNTDFWKSVHLGGDEARKIQEDALAAEKKAWKEKVVVDHLDFKVLFLWCKFSMSMYE